VPTVSLLLDAGANPNAKNCDGESPIFTAIRWGQPEVISVLAHRGCDINGLNGQGLTPLAVAANFQSAGLVKALLACNATREVSGVPESELDVLTTQKFPLVNPIERLNKPMTANRSSRASKDVRSCETSDASALFDLVANNQSDSLKTEIEKGINASATAVYTGESLLHAAVAYGASECVHLLLEAGADVNATTTLYQESPLHLAIQEGFFDIFHDLVRHGADIESQNCEGEGPIFTAVKYNRVEMFRVLVRRGAAIHQLNFGGLAPIHFAVMDGNVFLTDSLLYHGATPAKGELNPYLFAFRAGDREIANNIQISAPSLAVPTRLTPGVFAAIKANDTDTLARLIIKGFDVNLVDVLEGAPLHCAVESDALDCLKLLIDNGANINVRSIQRLETPLQIAIRKNNKRIYDYLLQFEIDFTLRNKDGENTLFYAVRSANEEALDESIRRGVDVNDRNAVGITPLYVAVGLKQKGLVQKLLESHHANPSSEVHPSLKLANEMEDAELATLLEDSGASKTQVRAARIDARKLRSRGKPRPVVEVKSAAPPHNVGLCYVCERNKATQNLIPCGHVVSCRGCIKNFIEDHIPCPVCNLSFYATATVADT
jgi:ankyrin repeat protein